MKEMTALKQEFEELAKRLENIEEVGSLELKKVDDELKSLDSRAGLTYTAIASNPEIDLFEKVEAGNVWVDLKEAIRVKMIESSTAYTAKRQLLGVKFAQYRNVKIYKRENQKRINEFRFELDKHSALLNHISDPFAKENMEDTVKDDEKHIARAEELNEKYDKELSELERECRILLEGGKLPLVELTDEEEIIDEINRENTNPTYTKTIVEPKNEVVREEVKEPEEKVIAKFTPRDEEKLDNPLKDDNKVLPTKQEEDEELLASVKPPKKDYDEEAALKKALPPRLEETKAKYEPADIFEVVRDIKKLNPDAEIKTGDVGIDSRAGERFFSSIPADKLVLPEGFYYNEKNGITNKHNTASGLYLAFDVEPLEEKMEKVPAPKKEETKVVPPRLEPKEEKEEKEEKTIVKEPKKEEVKKVPPRLEEKKEEYEHVGEMELDETPVDYKVKEPKPTLWKKIGKVVSRGILYLSLVGTSIQNGISAKFNKSNKVEKPVQKETMSATENEKKTEQNEEELKIELKSNEEKTPDVAAAKDLNTDTKVATTTDNTVKEEETKKENIDIAEEEAFMQFLQENGLSR